MSLAVADAVLTVIEEELQANAKEVGDYLMERLKALVDKYDRLGDVRYAIIYSVIPYNITFYTVTIILEGMVCLLDWRW